MEQSIIEAALRDSRVSAELVSQNEGDVVFGRVLYEFQIDIRNIDAWHGVIGSARLQRADGWKLACDFVARGECILFLGNEVPLLKFKNGDDLKVFIEEMPLFEFYIIDTSIEYVICFNRYDVLVGWGRARGWIFSLGDDD